MAEKMKLWLEVPLFSLVLLVCPVLLQDDCQYMYTTQPPEQLSCNPYVNGLTLGCRVRAPFNSVFSVEWYRASSTQTQPQIVHSERISENSPDFRIRRVHVNLPAGASELEDTPMFWCQVIADGRPLRPSREVFLQPESFYITSGFGNCTLSADQSVSDSACADLLSLSLSPSPSPTLSSTPSNNDDDKDDGGGSDDMSETALFVAIGVTLLCCVEVVLVVVLSICIYQLLVRRSRQVRSKITDDSKVDSDGATRVPIVHPESPSFQQHQGSEDALTASSQHEYQGLSSETKDYLSLYAVAPMPTGVSSTHPGTSSARCLQDSSPGLVTQPGNYESVSLATKDYASIYTVPSTPVDVASSHPDAPPAPSPHAESLTQPDSECGNYQSLLPGMEDYTPVYTSVGMSTATTGPTVYPDAT